jgi:hypothetical protein
MRKKPVNEPTSIPNHSAEESKYCINRMSERETVVLPKVVPADSCPCVEKLRTVLPLDVGIRDGVVHFAGRGVRPLGHEAHRRGRRF